MVNVLGDTICGNGRFRSVTRPVSMMFGPGVTRDEAAMGMLAVLIVLLVLLLVSVWSSARSYFAKGRLAGMEEATLEIIRGINSHYQSAGQPMPDQATKAVAAIKSFARGASFEARRLKRVSTGTMPGSGSSATPQAPSAGAGDMMPANNK
jgi:hypothetical protein